MSLININFVLNQKLLFYEYQLSRIATKIQEYDKNKGKNQDLELIHRDPSNLTKVLENELAQHREVSNKLSKQINYYKSKINETKIVENTMKEELNLKNTKTIVIAKKNINDYSTINNETNIQQVNNKSKLVGTNITELKNKLKIKREKIDDLKSQIEHYTTLNKKLELDNDTIKDKINEKYEVYCSLELKINK